MCSSDLRNSIEGFFHLENGKIFPISKNSYCFLKCKTCDIDLYPNKEEEKTFPIKKNENIEEYLNNCDDEFFILKYYKISKADNKEINENIYIGSKNEIENELIIKFIEQNIMDADEIIKNNTENRVILNLKKLNENLKNENKEIKKEIKNLNDKFLNVVKIMDDKYKNSNKFDKNESYDIVIDINSMINLNSDGWTIKYPKGKEEYERKMKMDTIIIGVIGNRNKGKSFILQKLSGYDVKQGFSVVTEGLSVKYGEEEDHCIAILDSAGKEAPLLNPKKSFSDKIDKDFGEKENNINQDDDDDINKNKYNKNQNDKNDELYEICLRDKLITETYLQRFIIEISHTLILVVGDINLNEQRLLENVKSSLKSDQYLYVIHNLLELISKEQVNDYINGKLKNLFGIKLKEINFKNNKGDYHQKYYVELDNEKVTHLIYVNEYSSIANYYNIPTINFLQTKNRAEQRRTKFSVVNECKKFLEKIGDNFIEEKITENNFENDNDEKIKLKDSQKINLKKVFIDEIGKTQTNTLDQPKYSYYTGENDSILIIDIEVPGEGADVKTKVEKNGDLYIFYFIGKKPCDQSVIGQKHKVHSTLKNQVEFNFKIYIPVKDITLGLNEKGKLNYFEKSQKEGIFKFKYHMYNGDQTDFE